MRAPSMEISLDALLGAQRDLADRLAQGVSGLLLHVHPPQPPKLIIPFDIELPFVGGGGGVDLPAAAVASLVEIGDRLGQAGSGLGASVGGAVQQLSRQIPSPFRAEGARRRRWEAAPPPTAEADGWLAPESAVGDGLALERAVGDRDPLEVAAAAAAAATGSAVAANGSGVADESDEEDDELGFEIGTLGRFKRPKVQMLDLHLN